MREAASTRSSRLALALGAPAPGETLQQLICRSCAAAAHKHWEGLIAVPPVTAGVDVVTQLLAHEEREAWQRLNAAGLTAFPLSPYCARARLTPALVMGFAAFDEAQIDAGAKAVAAALRGRA